MADDFEKLIEGSSMNSAAARRIRSSVKPEDLEKLSKYLEQYYLEESKEAE